MYLVDLFGGYIMYHPLKSLTAAPGDSIICDAMRIGDFRPPEGLKLLQLRIITLKTKQIEP